MTLIEESNKELILVSPYVNLSNWDKMKKCIQRAVNRNVDITFIARKNAKQDLSFFEQAGIKLILINDLHAKLYLNENYGIVTSQNIVYYSDINSIDIAYKTTEDSEKIELLDFIKIYITDISSKQNSLINKVEEIDYEGVPQLSNWKLTKLIKYFTTKYQQAKFNPATNYVFSGNLLPFSDVMISSIFVIKISKSFHRCDDIIGEISKIQFNFKHSFRIDLLTSHNKFYYLEFIPIEKFNGDNLIKDFEQLTDSILKSHTILNIVAENVKKHPAW
tara:strand:+ start:314 stop:1141 length:828 start_codon:yes stop_codon:yes gene_type:complete